MAELESSLKTAPGGGTVYLVPDAVALCTQLHLVRRLMASEKFVIIIPIQGTIRSDYWNLVHLSVTPITLQPVFVD